MTLLLNIPINYPINHLWAGAPFGVSTLGSVFSG